MMVIFPKQDSMLYGFRLACNSYGMTARCIVESL